MVKTKMPKNKTKTTTPTRKRTRPTKEKRPSSRRRLWIILGLTFVLLGAGGGAGFYFLSQKNSADQEVSPEELAQRVQEAKQLVEREEYSAAIDRLGPELTKGYRDNPEALRLFAKSRTMTPSEDNKHLLDAIRVYRRASVLDPNDRETAKELFYLYQVIGEGDKAVEMAQVAIANGETDFGFRMSLGQQQRQIRKYSEASTLANELIAEDPSNLDAYQLQLAVMSDQKLSEDEIYEFVTNVTSGSNPNVPTRDQLMLTLAQIQGDAELTRLLTRKVSLEPVKSTKQAIQLARRLSRANDTDGSLKILEEASRKAPKNASEIDLPLIYRYLQDNRFDDVRELVARKFPNKSERPEEVTIVEGLVSWLDDPTTDLTPIVERLRTSETLLSRTWSNLFKQITLNDGNSLELVRITKQTAETYPRSAYLQFFHALALESLGETDMAIQTFRKSIRLAPRWGASRVQLAEVLNQLGDYRTAFVEASVALRSNPKFGRAFESILASSTGLIAQGEQLPQQQRSTIVDALRSISDKATEPQKQNLLQAIIARFEGKTKEADAQIRQFIASPDSVDQRMAKVLRQLATDSELTTKIGAIAEDTLGLTLIQLIDKAVELGSDNEAAGLAFIDDYRVNGEAAPAATIQRARAEYLTRIESEQAAGEWKKLVEANSTDLRLLKAAFYSITLKEEIETRRSILENLKQATDPDGLTYRLAEVRLMMDEDPSERMAAAAALKLNEILKENPRAILAYSMMVESYQRLKQPMQIAQLLEKAVEQGLNSPGIRLALAETLIELNDPGKAIPHAVAVQEDVRSSFLARQRAVQVMLNAKSYRVAAESIGKDLPAICEDTDQHFTMFGAYALASLRSSEEFDAVKLVGELPKKHERWFDLWLQLASDDDSLPNQAKQWLEVAKSWTDTNKFERHRKLSRAYRKLAARVDKEESLGFALELLEPVLDGVDATAADSMSQAGIFDALGKKKEAMAIYDEVAETTDGDETIRSIAFNNSASLNLQSGDTQTAKERIERAISIQQRPEFTDTLALILAAEGKWDEVTSLLANEVEKQPEDILLRVRYTDTLQQTGKLAQAEEQIQEIKVRVRTSADTSLKIWQRIRKLEETQYRLSSAEEATEQTAG